MISLIGYILHCIVYTTAQLDIMYVYGGVSLLMIILLVTIFKIVIWISGGLLRHNGNSG